MAGEIDGGTQDGAGAALVRILGNGIETHRCLAARALGRMQQRSGLDVLLAALMDEDEDVRTDAATALAQIADASAAEPLMQSLLGDPCPEVKLAAIDGLARLRHPDICSVLRRLVKGRDESVLLDDGDFYESGWDDWLDLQVKAIESLAALGDETAAEDIATAIDDEFGQDLSQVGFRALGRLKDAGVRVLSRYLDRSDVRDRRRAVSVLAGMGGETAAAAVAQAFDDPASEVRLALVEGLAEAPDETRLARLLADPSTEVRLCTLERWGAGMPDLVASALDDPEATVRAAALGALSQKQDAVSAEDLSRIRRRLDDAPSVAARAALALAALDAEGAIEELPGIVRDGERGPEARLGALEALVPIGGDEVVRIAGEAATDPDRQLRLGALSVLARLAVGVDEWPNAAGDRLLEILGVAEDAAETTAAETESEVEAITDDGDEPAEPAPEPETVAEPEPAGAKIYPTRTLAAIMAADQTAAMPQAAAEEVALSDEDLDYLALAKATPRKGRASPTPDIPADLDARRFAARLLGDVAEPDVAQALAGHLASDDSELRLAAVDSLSRIAARRTDLPSAVREELQVCLSDTDRDMRLQAARALGAACDSGAVESLKSCLADADGFVRIEAIRALSALGACAAEVTELLDDPEPG
ncbi:MAG: HEAT repeat domain-containing protein, partial [Alphaproteobacteria bacterium]|nr:HEAT repeat domain-containing protein [Alphaproteobacteria bacterium]